MYKDEAPDEVDVSSINENIPNFRDLQLVEKVSKNKFS